MTDSLEQLTLAIKLFINKKKELLSSSTVGSCGALLMPMSFVRAEPGKPLLLYKSTRY